MSHKIVEITGIGPKTEGQLRAAHIECTDDLLQRCAHAEGRRTVASETGIGEAQLLEWTYRADLMRIPGVGGPYAELLEAAGVDTIRELRNRDAENLTSLMLRINAERHLAQTCPSCRLVHGWIEEAKKTDACISY